ncbi:carboxypeptidase-like regulatory domain-containing protein [Chitinophaga rhizosphaerae]|uniref:carboxypeptidase-like regulatory domain-containing protein n=1 Tax=Chitinophaga rhizosphaerae TaxID=1864947 RepID=UPI000F7FBA32|nr:carboxypeptidase-like regulatory domain-containing protein [Chitinophaga rhizosphaerae]
MRSFLFFALLIISVPTFSQSVTISGQARDASRKTPLAFVTLTLHRATDSSLVAGTVSGDDGRFSIPAPTTGKFNPSASLNCRKSRVNLFFQGDSLHTHTLNKIEFTDRLYAAGYTIRQQLKRNRRTNVTSGKAGADWFVDDHNTLTVSGLYSREKILDNGDQPFFDNPLKNRHHLWPQTWPERSASNGKWMETASIIPVPIITKRR